MVSFAEPARLWLLLVPAVGVVLAWLRSRRRLRQQRRLASPAVWRRLMGGVPATGLLRLLAWCGAAAALVLALARPQWGELPEQVSIRTRDLVVALDVSDSMLCPDVSPDRLRRSLEVLTRALPSFDGNRVGVVVFAGDAYPLVPATRDLNAVAAFLAAVEPGMVATPGSNLERAVATSLELLPGEGEGRVVVVMTDGENLQGDMEHATGALRDAGVELLAVVAGTEAGGPIPLTGPQGGVRYKRDTDGRPVVTRARPAALEGLADAVDGAVIRLDEPDAVRHLVEAVAALRTREAESERSVRRVERFPLALILAAVLGVLAFLLSPWRRRGLAFGALVIGLAGAGPAAAQAPPAVAVPVQTPAAAPSPAAAPAEPAWWQRLVPGGSRRLARAGVAAWRDGDVDRAVEDFAGAARLAPDDPRRHFDLGTALGAAGDLSTALPLLAAAHQQGVPGAAYNAGTAALEQQDTDAAVRWLRDAVVADPDDVDAKHNYELALRLQQQQQQQQQDQNDQDQQDQDQQDQNDQQNNGDQQNQDQQQDQQQQGQPQPTPTPGPQSAAGAPTPTPGASSDAALLAALERAEAEAREAMRTPTPQTATVEKDW